MHTNLSDKTFEAVLAASPVGGKRALSPVLYLGHVNLPHDKIVLPDENNRYVPSRDSLTIALLLRVPQRKEEAGMTAKEQFECLMEPTGTWMVWDVAEARPAQYMRNSLVGLPRHKALLLCRLLNAMAADERFQSLAS